MGRRHLGLWLVLLVACKSKPSGRGEPPAAPSDAAQAIDAAPGWELHSAPVELRCGPPAKVVPPPAGGERPLPRDQPMTACQAQASVDAVCACLTKSAATWAEPTGIATKKLECAPAPQVAARARMLEVRGVTGDDDEVAAGTAYVLATEHAGAWSALAIVESAPDVDLGETPRATHGASVTRFEERGFADLTVLWIESQDTYSETGMGEMEATGEAQLTLCLMATADRPAACFARVPLARWDYSLELAKGESADACTVRTAVSYAATLDASGLLTVSLERGRDEAGAAGRYRLLP